MGSYEWMELQTLTAEIAAARSRLGAARSKRDHGRVRALQEEIAAAEARRDRLLAYISTNLGSVPENATPPAEMEGATLREALASAAAVAEARQDETEAEQQPDESGGQDGATAVEEPPPVEPKAELPTAPQTADAVTAVAGAPVVAAATADGTEGAATAWDQLTPGDIGRVKHEIAARRAEMLARHAEELKRLEGDQAELEVLAQAIAAFAEKFAKRSVVNLDQQRELRQQSGG